HFAHTLREALRDGDVRLCLARGQVTGVENRSELVPTLGRRRFDDARDRSIQQEGKQERRGDRLIRLHPSVRVSQALYQQLLDEAARMGGQVTVDGRQQSRQQSATTQHLVATLAVTGQKQLQGLI